MREAVKRVGAMGAGVGHMRVISNSYSGGSVEKRVKHMYIQTSRRCMDDEVYDITIPGNNLE